MHGDDLEEGESGSDSQRIEALEEAVLGLKFLIENLTAGEMVLSARLEAFQKVTAQFVGQPPSTSSTPEMFLAAVRELEREARHDLLAGISDKNPRSATILKEMIDRILPPDLKSS